MIGVLVRRLCTSTPVQTLIQPPVQVFGVEGRYATALYSAATKQKTLDKIEKDMQLIKNTLDKDVKLREFCINPSLQRLTKVTGISQVLDKLKVNETAKNLFGNFIHVYICIHLLLNNDSVYKTYTITARFPKIEVVSFLKRFIEPWIEKCSSLES
ncbi:ATP synthase subunit O, mitochondrial [Schistosoma japonicum]|nr:ATP synthase subunit O, mitochondrial [Schistosoma japonicum]